MLTAKNFDTDSKDDISLYRLKPSNREELLESLPDKFRICYVSDVELERLSKANGVTQGEFMQHYLPDKGNVMSGDFGEFLSYYLTKDLCADKKSRIAGPKKWRWKQDRNKPAPHTDILLFKIRDRKSKTNNPNDEVIAVESKMKSVKKKDYSPIQNAVDGAKTDKLSRMAKSLDWYFDQYAKDGKPKLKELVNRYRFPDEFGSYKKSFKAIAIIDETLFEDEISKAITDMDDEIDIWAVSISDLKNAYETVFEQIPNTVEDEPERAVK